MLDVVGLVLPFFGLIFLGVVAARLTNLPAEGLSWLNFFVVYAALPALFFQLLSKTPVKQLTEWSYIAATTLSTATVFALMFGHAMLRRPRNIAESTIQGLAAAYGNIGYMGPGIALFAFGPAAAVPVALIFCFETILHFTVTPMLMALSGRADARGPALVLFVLRRIVLHPFIIAAILGVAAAALQVVPPAPVERMLATLAGAAAPCALFAMGVTLALRPLKRLPRSMPLIVTAKLLVHPALCYVLLGLFGNFDPVWVYTAVLMTALPTATNVYVLAEQYSTWVERASACILVSTILSVGSVTAILYLINARVLPPDLFPGGPF